MALDVARALAVLGIVLNHAVDGLIGAGIVDGRSELATANSALYIFRMPALAFLIGIFLPRAVERRGLNSYLRERVLLFTYLYLVWFFIHSGLEVATSSLKNVPRDPSSLLTLWVPPAHLWFIPFLIVASVVVGVLQPWRPRLTGYLGLAGIGAASLLLWGWNPSIVGLRGLPLLIFVAAGSAVTLPRLRTLLRLPRSWWWFGGAVAGSGFLLLWCTGLVPATQDVRTDLATDARSAAAAVLGTVVVLSLAVVLSRVPVVAAALATVGSRTLPVYLGHVVVVAGARIVLDALGVDEPVLYVLVLVPLGVLVPLTAALLAPRLHLRWLFELPPVLRRAAPGRGRG